MALLCSDWTKQLQDGAAEWHHAGDGGGGEDWGESDSCQAGYWDGDSFQDSHGGSR